MGRRNWTILKDNLAGVIRVSEASITQGVQLLWAVGLRVEPTGALTLGALLQAEVLKGKKVLAVISGGNVDSEIFNALIAKV